jgi:hypothetical protein
VPSVTNNSDFCLKISRMGAIMRKSRQKTSEKIEKQGNFVMKVPVFRQAAFPTRVCP